MLLPLLFHVQINKSFDKKQKDYQSFATNDTAIMSTVSNHTRDWGWIALRGTGTGTGIVEESTLSLYFMP